MAEETRTVSRSEPIFKASMQWRRIKAHFFVVLGLLSVLLGVVTLLVLLADVIIQSTGWLDWQFLPASTRVFRNVPGLRRYSSARSI